MLAGWRFFAIFGSDTNPGKLGMLFPFCGRGSKWAKCGGIRWCGTCPFGPPIWLNKLANLFDISVCCFGVCCFWPGGILRFPPISWSNPPIISSIEEGWLRNKSFELLVDEWCSIGGVKSWSNLEYRFSNFADWPEYFLFINVSGVSTEASLVSLIGSLAVNCDNEELCGGGGGVCGCESAFLP